MFAAFSRVLAPRAIRLYCVLSLRLTVTSTPPSVLTITWLAAASIFFTSPITPETAGAGEALGVCPRAPRPRLNRETTANMKIDSLFTKFLSFDRKLSIIYASQSLIVAKVLEPSSKSVYSDAIDWMPKPGSREKIFQRRDFWLSSCCASCCATSASNFCCCSGVSKARILARAFIRGSSKRGLNSVRRVRYSLRVSSRIVRTEVVCWSVSFNSLRIFSKRSCMARSRASAPPPPARDRYKPVSAAPVTLPSRNTTSNTSQIFRVVRPVKVIYRLSRSFRSTCITINHDREYFITRQRVPSEYRLFHSRITRISQGFVVQSIAGGRRTGADRPDRQYRSQDGDQSHRGNRATRYEKQRQPATGFFSPALLLCYPRPQSRVQKRRSRGRLNLIIIPGRGEQH